MVEIKSRLIKTLTFEEASAQIKKDETMELNKDISQLYFI